MECLLIGSLLFLVLLGSLAVEAFPDILRAMFKKGATGKYSQAQRVGLGIAIAITAAIIVWAIYHTVTELQNPPSPW